MRRAASGMPTAKTSLSVATYAPLRVHLTVLDCISYYTIDMPNWQDKCAMLESDLWLPTRLRALPKELRWQSAERKNSAANCRG